MKKNKASPSYHREQSKLGYISVSPMPSKEELSEFYAKIYYQETATATYQSEYSEDELSQQKLRCDLMLHAISLKRSGEKGRFLEVGCGEGFLLNAASKSGYDVEGIDFSIYGIESFHPHLVDKVHTGDAFDLLDHFNDQGKQVDVCVLQNVLEHVVDPELLLDRIKSIVSPKGIVAITVPNDFSALQEKVIAMGLSEREYWFLPPQHLHYFNVETITKLVAEKGFNLLDAYGDFPIEMFLFHHGSNYALDRSMGKGAHQARVVLDLLLARNGIHPYHSFCQSMTKCGFGRNVTVLIKPSDKS